MPPPNSPTLWSARCAQSPAACPSRRADDNPLLAGLCLGPLLTLAIDELAHPVLGVAAPPTSYPPRAHLYRLGTRLAYGLTLTLAVESLYQLTRARRGR
jgi:hypothetical protein